MKHTKFSMSVIAGLVLLAGEVQATVSGNIGVASNYLWRGVTQTNDSVAVQGGIDYSHDSGFYLGTWASNVDFGDDTSYELDFYGGYSGSIGEDFGYDIGYLYYGYPDAKGDIDFGELALTLSWKWFELGYAKVVNAGDDVAKAPLDNKDLSYIHAGFSYPITETVTLTAHYGYSDGDVVQSWFQVSNYADYHLAISKDTGIGSVSFMVADTDLPDDDAKIVLSYVYEFEF
ncbi:MAG: TorF family putative porin [Shewanella indica]|uniref:TorF family putative porin n=1 Tax=Shewanella indica TaxID=768528 RepID=UPI0030050AB6